MAEAIAKAAEVPASTVRRALMFSGDLAEVAVAALSRGREGLARFSIQLFRPVQPMLAATAEDVAEAIERFQTTELEYKLDGARVQVHRAGDEVRVYTRGLNDVTAAVPELVEGALALPVREIILDGETLAFRGDGKPHPFQVTMRRFGRKLDVERLRQELPLDALYFDLLYLDGASLTDRPASERVEALARVLPAQLTIPRAVTGDPEEARAFLRRALAAGHEGIMAKDLDAPYEAGRRGQSWLKLKPAHTLDLVVLAAEWGSGRRRGWLSNLHLGARDPVGGGFVMLGKTFKGLTDELLEWQTRRLLELETARDDYTVFVKPELVVEIAFNDVQHSPHYPAGMALRFARVKRYRTDKRPEDADTIATVRQIFERQVG
jgi:DNA ligase-1